MYIFDFTWCLSVTLRTKHRYRVSYSSSNYRQALAAVASMEMRLATPNRSFTYSGVVQNKPALQLASSP